MNGARGELAGNLFDALLARPGFRADLLHFIRLAGNYAAHIFADVRNRAPFKHRRAFDDWLAAHGMKDKQLAQALTRHDAWFDALKADFTLVLEEMPQYMRDRLARALGEDHVIPWDLRTFIRALDDLREYRGWLEHPEERQQRGEKRPRISDDRLLGILGTMLVPFLSAHLVGRIRHHGLRAGLPRRQAHAIAESAKAKLNFAIASRREASRFMNGLKRRTAHEDIAAELERKRGKPPSEREVHKIAKARRKERKDLESRKAALLALYRHYFTTTTWPRYNLENFLIRFGFIGRARIAELERKLGLKGKAGDFVHAIEPAFMLATDMALVLHDWITELEACGVPVRNRKEMRKLNPAAEALPAIRNAIAHGGWIWAVEHPQGSGQLLSPRAVLETLLAALEHPRVSEKALWRNTLFTRLEGALRPCAWHYIQAKAQKGDDPNAKPACYVVKRWTKHKRDRFADRDRWHVERRLALRRLAAQWMREIAWVRQAVCERN